MRFPNAYDATITRADFVRLLPEATGSDDFTAVGDRFLGAGWSVRLTPIAPLAIGLFRLERHRVEIEFDGWPAHEQDAFMQRFTRHYQRGGG